MNDWTLALITAALVLSYEVWRGFGRGGSQRGVARKVHASLRQDWFAAVSAQPGAEILAVQTLRNSLMSASLTASTAVLGLMGSITLAAPSVRSSFERIGAGMPLLTPRLAMELALLLLLFLSLVCSVMALRYYTHASFICAMPVESAARARWMAAGSLYVSRAGLLYSWSLRNLLLIVPVVAFLLYPPAAPAVAVLVTALLFVFDHSRATPAEP